MAHIILEHFRPDECPRLTELVTGYVLQPGYDYGDEFEFGLRLILDGLRQDLRALGQVFGDATVAAAMIDRLLNHAEVVSLKGNSYRRAVRRDR